MEQRARNQFARGQRAQRLHGNAVALGEGSHPAGSQRCVAKGRRGAVGANRQCRLRNEPAAAFRLGQGARQGGKKRGIRGLARLQCEALAVQRLPGRAGRLLSQGCAGEVLGQNLAVAAALARHLRRAGLAEAHAVAGAAPVKKKAVALGRNFKPVAANLVPPQGPAHGQAKAFRRNLHRANQQRGGAAGVSAFGDGQALPSGRGQPGGGQSLGQLRARERCRPLARSGALAVTVGVRNQVPQRFVFPRCAVRPNLLGCRRPPPAVLMKVCRGAAAVEPQNLAGGGQSRRMSLGRRAPMHPLAMGRVAYIEAGVAMRGLQSKAARHHGQRLAGFRSIRRAALGGHNQLDVPLHRQRSDQAERARLRRDAQWPGQRQRFPVSCQPVTAGKQQVSRRMGSAVLIRPGQRPILDPHCNRRQRPGGAGCAEAKRRSGKRRNGQITIAPQRPHAHADRGARSGLPGLARSSRSARGQAECARGKADCQNRPSHGFLSGESASTLAATWAASAPCPTGR